MICAIENEQYRSLFGHFAELDQILGSLYGTYLDELQYLAAQEPANEFAERIGEQFALVRPLVATLGDDLSIDEPSAALDSLKELRSVCSTLYSLFAQYKNALTQGPQYSENPYTQELLRVCHHYLAGELSVDAVQGRLEAFCQYHEALETHVSTLFPSPPEREIFEKRLPDLEEALSLQLQAIEDLDVALERQDQEALKDSLELFSEAAGELVDVYKALQKADLEPKTVTCIRCGAKNSTVARICGECAAVLPQSAADIETQSTLAVEEDGSVVGPKESEKIAKLQAAVSRCLSTGESNELLDAIAGYQKKWERSRQQFSRLDPPPADLPEEQLRLLQKARSHFAAGLELFKEGLEHLKTAASKLDPLELEEGMALMKDGEEQFFEFHQLVLTAEQISLK